MFHTVPTVMIECEDNKENHLRQPDCQASHTSYTQQGREEEDSEEDDDSMFTSKTCVFNNESVFSSERMILCECS